MLKGASRLTDLFEAELRPLPFQTRSGKSLASTQVFEMYWQFAVERQEIFYKRIGGASYPWTADPILRAYRFTNVYRASDRTSQFLIRNVIYHGEQDPTEIFFRVLLFKLFNRIETWELLGERISTLAWKTFDVDRYNKVLDAAVNAGSSLYSAAYIMPCPTFGAKKKHTNHLLLLEEMMKAGVADRVFATSSLEEVYRILRSQRSLGDFLAFQFAIDLNYSAFLPFSEMDFVVAGPGAQSGIRKAFSDRGGLSDAEIIAEVAANADREFASRGLKFRSLGKRKLQLIDCQNLFCEIDKYSRVALPIFEGGGRTRIKRKYSPSEIHPPMPQWYPPKWGVEIP